MAGDLLLGVDIGSYSAKGVLCTPAGEVLATETVEHEMSLPRPGWAEHDADAIWWGGFVAITRRLLGGRVPGEDVGAVAVSAIGGCMLPVDARGRPLRPGVLYGIDTRAIDEIAWLNERFGEEALFDLGGMALTSQAIGPKILWLRRNEAGDLRPHPQGHHGELLSGPPPDRRVRDGPPHRVVLQPAHRRPCAGVGRALRRADHRPRPAADVALVERDRRRGDGGGGAPRPGCAPARR